MKKKAKPENGSKGNNAIGRGDAVYISGPMDGRPLYNYRAFFAYAGMMRRLLGCAVANPAENPAGLKTGEYAAIERDAIPRCTAMLLLDGWEESPGANREAAFAKADCPWMRFITQKEMDRLLEAALEREEGAVKKGRG